MAAELPRPGVEVIQQFVSASPTIIRPTLRPFVTGPAKEVIDVTTADGLVNSQAKQGQYSQLPKTISQSAFPSPRGNIAEVVVQNETIKVFFLNGGLLQELERDPGDSFLRDWNKATRAVLRTKRIPAEGLLINGTGGIVSPTIVLAVDVPARLNTTQDVVITFVSTGTHISAAQIAAQINNAVGEDIAEVVADSPGTRVQLVSKMVGAASSLTVRQGGSFNERLGFLVSTSTPELRVEGSGFRGQDQNNNTTLTPWVEWFRGGYIQAGVYTTWPTEDSDHFGAGLMYDDGTYITTYAPALAYTGSGSIDLKVGDLFYADGVQPNGARIMKIEAARFKLGTVNSQLSTYDSSGKLVTAVYDASNVNTLFASVPFVPHYAWFKAKNLLYTLLPQAAYLLGDTLGAPAEYALIEGVSNIVGDDTSPIGSSHPLSLAGLNLKFVVTVDGVEGDEQTFTFTGGPFTSVDAIATAIGTNIEGMFALADGSKLNFATSHLGAAQALQLKGTSTALARLGYTVGLDVTAAGKDVEFLDVPPRIKTSLVTPYVDPDDVLGGTTLKVKLSSNADQLSPTWGTARSHTFGVELADLDAIVADINADHSVDYTGALFGDFDTGTGMRIVAEKGGLPGAEYISLYAVFSESSVAASTKGLKFDSTSTCQTNDGMVFDDLAGGISEDVGEENLSGLTLKFRLNKRPKVYSVVFTSNSLVEAVDSINEAVGFPVASIAGSTEAQLKLTSTLKGYASCVEVVVDPWTTGTRPLSQKCAASLGYNVAGESSEDTMTAGIGRPNPDLYLDAQGNVCLGAEILRNSLTGEPFSPGLVDTYIQYIGLRKDVSPSAEHPALISLNDTSTLSTVLNPISSKNPLGLGMYFMMINAPGLECTGLGVDEISAAEPFGTPLAYSKVEGFIQSEELYGIAPLTHSEVVAQIFMNHCVFMSQPENKGERIVFINPAMPTRAIDGIVVSGTAGNTTATQNEFVGDANPTATLVSKGIDPQQEIPVSDDLFVQLVVATPNGSEVRNYSVKFVNGVVWTLRTVFASDENLDGFYTEATLDEPMVNVAYTMYIRGVPLVVTGSDIPDKNKIAETVQAKCMVYKNRRVYYTFPDKCKALLGGTEELLEGFYMPAAIVGMVAAQPPQQGFTNLPMAGFSGVVGSNDYFTNKQLNVMAAGGCYIIVQDAPGGPLTSRHQLSTNMTSIETRELSITKDVDYVAKFLRTGLRSFIGTFNITQPFLDTLSTVIHGMNQFLEENGILISADLNNLIQSKEQPDTVLVDETLDVPYPCNYIRLTLAI